MPCTSIATALQQPLAQVVTDKAVDPEDKHVFFPLLLGDLFQLAVETHADRQPELFRQLAASYINPVLNLTKQYFHCFVAACYGEGEMEITVPGSGACVSKLATELTFQNRTFRFPRKEKAPG